MTNQAIAASLNQPWAGPLVGQNNDTRRWNFVGAAALPGGLTMARLSGAGYFDTAGNYVMAGNNQPRFDGVMGSGAARGLLVEDSRTNSLRNSVSAGDAVGVLGAGGSLPTNWSVVSDNGLTLQVTQIATENGLDVFDLRMSGTASGTTLVLNMEDSNAIIAAAAQSWAASVYVRRRAGGRTNTSGYALRLLRDGGTVLADGDNGYDAINTSPMARLSVAVASTPTGTTRVWPQLVVTMTAGAAVDVTLRIGAPQLERGNAPSSYIPTTGAAATRAAELVTLSTAGWLNANAGTLAAAGIPMAVAGDNALANLGDGTTNNRLSLRGRSSSTIGGAVVVSGGAVQAQLDRTGMWAAEARFVLALGYAANDFGYAINTLPVLQDTAGSVPTVTQLEVGRIGSGSFLNGWVHWVSYTPSRLSDAQLVAMTE